MTAAWRTLRIRLATPVCGQCFGLVHSSPPKGEVQIHIGAIYGSKPLTSPYSWQNGQSSSVTIDLLANTNGSAGHQGNGAGNGATETKCRLCVPTLRQTGKKLRTDGTGGGFAFLLKATYLVERK